jgi:hypothetical protein
MPLLDYKDCGKLIALILRIVTCCAVGQREKQFKGVEI